MMTSGIIGALSTLLNVVAWIVAITFAVRMVRGGGDRAERFLLIGVSLMLVSSFVATIWVALMPWLVLKLTEAGSDRITIAISPVAVFLLLESSSWYTPTGKNLRLDPYQFQTS